MLETQKAIIHALWAANETQNKIAVQVGCSQLTILDNKTILFKTVQLWFQTAADESQLNRIPFSNQWVNCGEVSKAWNDAVIAVS